jgi:hypothetical protein
MISTLLSGKSSQVQMSRDPGRFPTVRSGALNGPGARVAERFARDSPTGFANGRQHFRRFSVLFLLILARKLRFDALAARFAEVQ